MKKLLLLISILISFNIYSQIGSQQTITTNAIGAYSVFSADLDGDGDMDVLFSSRSITNDNKIAWHENLNGLGSFGPEKIISTNLVFPLDLITSDLDGDGDMDVISVSVADDKIVWFENLDGFGNFGLEKIITSEVDSPQSFIITDIDGDGDMDVASSSINDNKIAWYENLDGLGGFGTQQIISTSVLRPNDIYYADLDGDGDVDLLSASIDDNKIAWYENLDGLGSFSTQQIISLDANSAWAVFSADLDGDGDIDVLSASILDDKIAWYENLDGLGGFGPQQIISTMLVDPSLVYAFDIDNDGDIDVVSVSVVDNKIVWYENTDGLGSFGDEKIITTIVDRPTSIYAADLDNDSDLELLSASFYDNRIAWYKNHYTTLSTHENMLLDFAIYPLPTTGILSIKSNSFIVRIEVYNKLGQLVKSNFNKDSIDISFLNQGLYFLKTIDENGYIGIKKVMKK